jgi:hypothetical protein
VFEIFQSERISVTSREELQLSSIQALEKDLDHWSFMSRRGKESVAQEEEIWAIRSRADSR